MALIVRGIVTPPVAWLAKSRGLYEFASVPVLTGPGTKTGSRESGWTLWAIVQAAMFALLDLARHLTAPDSAAPPSRALGYRSPRRQPAAPASPARRSPADRAHPAPAA